MGLPPMPPQKIRGGFAIDGGEALICEEGIIVVGQYDGDTSLVSVLPWKFKPQVGQRSAERFCWQEYGAEYIALQKGWTPGWPATPLFIEDWPTETADIEKLVREYIQKYS